MLNKSTESTELTESTKPNVYSHRTKPPGPGQKLERPILYISRATLPYETRYEASELEMACLARAVSRLRQYLEGSPFKVFTDHSAGGGTPVGWRSDLEDEVPHAEEPETR